MNKFGFLALCLVLSAAVAFAVSKHGGATTEASSHKETSYERVIRTGTLRCGYEFWDGGFMQDLKTGDIFGPWKDFADELGRVTKLKIEWTDHIGWAHFPADLKSGKIDAMCVGIWRDALRAKEIALSNPLVYQGFEAFARTDDHRFDGNLEAIDNPDVNVMVIEGDTSEFLAQQDFPKAKRIPLGTLNATDSELFLGVAMNKADVTFDIPGMWRQFDKNDPGKVRRVDPGHYLKIVGVGFAMDNDDWRLQQLFNVAVAEMVDTGAVDRILKKYEDVYPEMFIKKAPDYVR